MLKNELINPQIIAALALCGHGDKILIADGNYPLDSKTSNAAKVYLGLSKGTPSATKVLEVLLSAVNAECAEVMKPDGSEEPPIFGEFSGLLNGMELKALSRYDFYNACEDKNVKLAISTGEERTFANILITIGVA